MNRRSNLTLVGYLQFGKLNRGRSIRPRPLVKGVSKKWNKRIPLESLLVKNRFCNTASLKRRLYEEKLKEERCEECDQLPEWNGKKLVLHLDHIDGDASNNVITNLRILCPNCHTQTSTYCRGQRKTNLNTLVVK